MVTIGAASVSAVMIALNESALRSLLVAVKVSLYLPLSVTLNTNWRLSGLPGTGTPATRVLLGSINIKPSRISRLVRATSVTVVPRYARTIGSFATSFLRRRYFGYS